MQTIRVFRGGVTALLIGAVCAVMVVADGRAPDNEQPGLMAHYYRYAVNWDGNWPDTSPVPSASPSQWTFSNYAYSRKESVINHQFINNGWFTVRWQGLLDTHPRPEANAGSATYEFEIWADDGCRLYVDGRPLIDSWIPCAEDSPAARRTATVVLTPGKHEIVVEYFQGQSLKNGDRDPIKLSWSCPDRKIPKQPVPASHLSHTDAHANPEAGRLD